MQMYKMIKFQHRAWSWRDCCQQKVQHAIFLWFAFCAHKSTA